MELGRAQLLVGRGVGPWCGCGGGGIGGGCGGCGGAGVDKGAEVEEVRGGGLGSCGGGGARGEEADAVGTGGLVVMGVVTTAAAAAEEESEGEGDEGEGEEGEGDGRDELGG